MSERPALADLERVDPRTFECINEIRTALLENGASKDFVQRVLPGLVHYRHLLRALSGVESTDVGYLDPKYVGEDRPRRLGDGIAVVSTVLASRDPQATDDVQRVTAVTRAQYDVILENPDAPIEFQLVDRTSSSESVKHIQPAGRLL